MKITPSSLFSFLSNFKKAFTNWRGDSAIEDTKTLEGAKEDMGETSDLDAVRVLGAVTSNLQVLTAKVYNSPVGGVPIPGPYCGPSDIKAITWLFPDGYIYGTKTIWFAEACKNHNGCVSLGTTPEVECAKAFHEEMQKECKDKLAGLAYDDCLKIALAYVVTVSSLEDLASEAKAELISTMHINLPMLNTGTIHEKICSSSFLSGNKLEVGEHLYSQNDKYFVVMQSDGNLVEYISEGRNVVWQTSTTDIGALGHFLAMQSDGGLFLYDGNGVATWSSGSILPESKGEYCLHIQNDGALVVNNELNGDVLWTNGVHQNNEL